MARQRHQIRRLQVVHELIKLEAEYAAAVGKATKVVIKDFDPDLVAKVKQQPWYIVARATAAQARDRGPGFSPPPRAAKAK